MTNEDLMQAFDACAAAIKQDPSNCAAYVGAAKIAATLGKWEEAAHLAKLSFSRGNAKFSDENQKLTAIAHQVLGDAAQIKGNFVDATSRYNMSLMCNPCDAHTLSSMAMLEDKVGNYPAALKLHEKAYSMDKADATIRYNLSTKQLANGKFSEGWTNYTARHEMLMKRGVGREYHCPALNTPLQIDDGKYFIWADQGIGDQVMFSKFLYDLYDLGQAKITLEVATKLVPVMRRSFPFLENVVGTQDVLDPVFMKQFDGHMNLQDAAAGFILKYEDIVTQHNQFGWLKPDKDRVRNISQCMGQDKLRVGLSWASPRSKDSLKKSMPIDALKDIIDMDGVQTYSLQYGLTQEQIVYINNTKKHMITGLWSELMDDDLEGLIAKISCCDVVVTISNATAHLAGALGIPCIVMVPVGYGCHWHWFYDRADSPWYGSVSIVRQRRVGEWPAVVSEVVDNLKTIVKQSKETKHG